MRAEARGRGQAAQLRAGERSPGRPSAAARGREQGREGRGGGQAAAVPCGCVCAGRERRREEEQGRGSGGAGVPAGPAGRAAVPRSSFPTAGLRAGAVGSGGAVGRCPPLPRRAGARPPSPPASPPRKAEAPGRGVTGAVSLFSAAPSSSGPACARAVPLSPAATRREAATPGALPAGNLPHSPEEEGWGGGEAKTPPKGKGGAGSQRRERPPNLEWCQRACFSPDPPVI